MHKEKEKKKKKGKERLNLQDKDRWIYLSKQQWRKVARIVARYLDKGTRLKKENWNDKESYIHTHTYMHNSFFDTFIREYQRKKIHFSTSKFEKRKGNEESLLQNYNEKKKKKTNSFSLNL